MSYKQSGAQRLFFFSSLVLGGRVSEHIFMTDFWLIFFFEGLSSNSWKRSCVWMFVVVFSPKLFNKETCKKRVQHPLANQSEEEVLSNQKKWWVDTSVIDTAQKQSPFCALAVNLFLLRFPWLFLLWCNWRNLTRSSIVIKVREKFWQM